MPPDSDWIFYNKFSRSPSISPPELKNRISIPSVEIYERKNLWCGAIEWGSGFWHDYKIIVVMRERRSAEILLSWKKNNRACKSMDFWWNGSEGETGTNCEEEKKIGRKMHCGKK
jgi:hypothetical protein